jgi:hypothetical protein
MVGMGDDGAESGWAVGPVSGRRGERAVEVVVRGLPWRCGKCMSGGLAVMFVHEEGEADAASALPADSGPVLSYARDLLAADRHPQAAGIRSRRLGRRAEARLCNGCRRCDTAFSAFQLREESLRLLREDGVAALPVLAQHTRPATEWAFIQLAADAVDLAVAAPEPPRAGWSAS